MVNAGDLIFDVHGIASRLTKFKVHFERGFFYDIYSNAVISSDNRPIASSCRVTSE